jgi:hypothetical protein
MPSLPSLLWRTLYGRWRVPPPPTPQPGYTLLVPVPGDLPVFLELALTVCGRLDPEHRVETLVIPDRPNAVCAAVVERHARTWPGPLRMVWLRRPDRWLTRWLNNPHNNHFLQLLNGAEHARSTHFLLHDADLFLFDPDSLRRQYEACAGRGLACLGVNPVWDGWFAQRGIQLAATWELTGELAWLRGFPPYLHRGHDDTLGGERHTFDTTLYPQCHTPPERVTVQSMAGGFVHFNYVICTYRFFQNARGPYEDDHFRLLLVRLLIDLFDRTGWRYELPPLPDLQRGLSDPRARVTYVGPETAGRYPEFRGKLEELLAGPLLTPDQAGRVREGVRPFDAAFGGVARVPCGPGG